MEDKKDDKLEEKINDSFYYSFIYKKTEKLTTAIYLVTNFLSDNEPMKWSLREKSLDNLACIFILKDIIEVKDILKDNLSFNNIKTSVLEIVSLLEISKMSGLVSEMNFAVLKKEYDSVIEIIDRLKNLECENTKNILPRDFFKIDEIEKDELFLTEDGLSDIKRLDRREEFLKGGKGHKLLSYGSLYKTNAVLKSKGQNDDKTSNEERKVFKKNESNNSFSKEDRKGKILSIIKDKKEVMIKDISQNISGCSEKTIQRELIAMVKDNILKKEGERRWSKYSLNLNLSED